MDINKNALINTEAIELQGVLWFRGLRKIGVTVLYVFLY